MSNFTNSPLTSITRISPNRTSPRNQPIQKITIHHTAGVLCIENLLSFLSNSSARASYNYVVGNDGRVGLCVEERDRCWGTSSGANDNQAIVIGVANSSSGGSWPISETAYEALIDLCVDICERNPSITQVDGLRGLTYNNSASGSLTRHNFFANTLCPAAFLQERLPLIAEAVNKKMRILLEDEEMTQERFNEMFAVAINEWIQKNSTLPESPWSADGGHFKKATELKVLDGSAPQGWMTREQFASVLGRLELIK